MAHQATIRGIGMSVGPGGAGAPAVLLAARDELVPIFIGVGQAQSIEKARQDVPAERPLTHDLFAGVLEDLDATLDRVRIDALEDDTFFAKLDLTVTRGASEERLVRDARPSDGIALAVRVGCPVTIADDVLEEAGRDPEQLAQGPAPGSQGGPPGTGMPTGRGTRQTDAGASESADSIDFDAGVEIDIDETDDPAPDEADSGEGSADDEDDTDHESGGDDDVDTDSAGTDEQP